MKKIKAIASIVLLSMACPVSADVEPTDTLMVDGSGGYGFLIVSVVRSGENVRVLQEENGVYREIIPSTPADVVFDAQVEDNAAYAIMMKDDKFFLAQSDGKRIDLQMDECYYASPGLIHGYGNGEVKTYFYKLEKMFSLFATDDHEAFYWEVERPHKDFKEISFGIIIKKNGVCRLYPDDVIVKEKKTSFKLPDGRKICKWPYETWHSAEDLVRDIQLCGYRNRLMRELFNLDD
ncbi:MAG: hypothetical protein IJ864_01175 [Alphaproteobacteria bacterium]|nr:hypothetical protein [Alphaproteobacteria bacterium]